MRSPRWRILVPVALLATLLAPAMRAAPIGSLLPDPWLLLLIWAVPEPLPFSWRKAVFLVLLLGVLRAAVSAVSPFACWAGLGFGLVVRHGISRRVVDRAFVVRLGIGVAAALPQVVFDLRAAALLGADLATGPLLVRALALGVLWAAALSPASLPVTSRLGPGARSARLGRAA
ncbi:MAG TPA: hypothetical protein VGC54_01070 [Planctomycetota bacterium]